MKYGGKLLTIRKTYQVQITERLQKVVDVEAYSRQEAKDEITEKYREGEIVLDSSDFLDYRIDILY